MFDCLWRMRHREWGERKGQKLRGNREKKKERESEKGQNERQDQEVRIEAVKLSSPPSRGPRPAALQLHSHLGQTQREGSSSPLKALKPGPSALQPAV